MTKFILSSIIATTFMFASFTTTANAAVSTSSKASVKKVKDAGDIYTIGSMVFYEEEDGTLTLICDCN
jgi:methionyl-tRNA synthetase